MQFLRIHKGTEVRTFVNIVSQDTQGDRSSNFCKCSFSEYTTGQKFELCVLGIFDMMLMPVCFKFEKKFF